MTDAEYEERDRLEELFSRQGCRTESYYAHYKRKDGKLGRWQHDYSAWYSPLNACCVCGRLGGRRHVRSRWQNVGLSTASGYDHAQYELCMACYSTKLALRRFADEIEEIRCLISTLRKLSVQPRFTSSHPNQTETQWKSLAKSCPEPTPSLPAPRAER